MKKTRAIEILQSLVNGVDPITGQELPAGTLLQHADVLRAMLAGVNALQDAAAREERRAQLPESVGKPWSEAEHERLITAFKAGEPIPTLAKNHGRTVRAIESRLERAGLLTAKERTTKYFGAGEASSE